VGWDGCSGLRRNKEGDGLSYSRLTVVCLQSSCTPSSFSCPLMPSHVKLHVNCDQSNAAVSVHIHALGIKILPSPLFTRSAPKSTRTFPTQAQHCTFHHHIFVRTLCLADIRRIKMSQQALNKVAPNSPSRQNPSEIETSIATALYELETNIPDMRSALRPLQFVSAREVRYHIPRRLAIYRNVGVVDLANGLPL